MSAVPILDRQQTPGGGGGVGGLPAVASGNDNEAAGQDNTQQVTDAASTTPTSCGQKLITALTDYAPPSLGLFQHGAPPRPQSQLSMSCIGPTDVGEDTRKPFDRRRRRQQGQRPNDCDKNKQHDDSDAQDACTNNQTLDSQEVRQINQRASGDDGARSTSAADSQLRFKLPNPIHDAPTSPGRPSEQHPAPSNISGSAPVPMISATNNKPLAIIRHHSTIEMSSTPVANRMLKRKTSVFSHNGFMGLHKLDQSAIQQHAIVSAAAAAVAASNVPRDEAASALQQQVDKSKDQSVSKTTTTAASSPPRQPYRSDTLGSTGSSRASSCDEPTIVSPTKLLAPTPLKVLEPNPGNNLIPIPSSQDPARAATCAGLSPLDSLAKRIITGPHQQGQGERQQDDAGPTMMQCDNENDDDNDMNNAHEGGAKQANSRKGQQQQDSTSDEDDDELDDEEEEEEEDDNDDENTKTDENGERPQRVSLSTNFRESLKIPPFESIKTQIKKNSIPNAEDIKRHIEKLISRNEEIIDNWNQVSIRSYNSSSSSGAPTAAAAAAAAATSASTNRRPSKRWSTTALCTKGSGIMLNQPNASTSSGDHNDEISPGKSISGIERKRSHIHHPVRRVSQQHKPLTIFNELQPHQATTTCSQQQQHLHVQTTMGSAFPCPTQISHSMPSSPKRVVLPFSDVGNHQQLSPNYQHQTIESAIENLSLKKRHGEDGAFPNQTIDNQASSNSGNDLVMAALLVERQRQQQLLDEYLRQRAATSDHHHPMINFTQQAQVAAPQTTPSLPNPILDHYQQQLTSHHQQQQQQQQQQQLIEHQLGLSRLAALENELIQQRQQQQQAMADLMSAASLQSQRSLAAAASLTLPQTAGQFNPQAAALENQLLNEYIAKMILSRQQDHPLNKTQSLELAPKLAGRSSPIGQQLNGGRPVGPFQVSPTSPSRVYLGHGNELQTQSLDSATPSYRCEACDISFWTRDLLNYHSMTSCSARTGPRPSKPIAFSFNQPNGFDSSHTSTDVASQSSLRSPTVIVSCADTGATSSAAATSYQHPHHKPAGPARRRTYDELNAPSSPYMASYRDLLIRNHQQHENSHLRQLSTSSIDYRQIREQHQQQQQQQQQAQLSPFGPSKSGALVAPRSPHKTRESAELAWQQRLEELSILKQQLSLNGCVGLTGLANLAADQQQQQQQEQQLQRARQVALSGNENHESKLPIKKRKISEPNMKY